MADAVGYRSLRMVCLSLHGFQNFFVWHIFKESILEEFQAIILGVGKNFPVKGYESP
jgi:hypothetical protein